VTDNLTTITIAKEGADTAAIRTSGYIVLYLVGDRIQFKGDIAIASLAPYLMKILADKFVK